VASSSDTHASSWLCSSEDDRARLLELTRRNLPVSVLLLFTVMPIAVLTALKVGPIILAPYLTGALGMAVVAILVPHRVRPELWLFGGDVLTMGAIAWGVALSGGSQSPILCLLALPLVGAAIRYNRRALVVFTALTLVAIAVASGLASHHAYDYDNLRFTGILTTVIGLALLVLPLTQAEREAREQSLLDPLTKTLNRLALSRRIEELRAQVSVGHAGLTVIAADIDHFKEINDTYGHETGDTILCGVADALRTHLRAFPLLYRTGGEEFAAVLPGLSLAEGAEIAERLRVAVEELEPNGMHITLSFGVAFSADDPESVLAAADRCLYRAKRSGRNRVVTEEALPAAPPACGGSELSLGNTRRLIGVWSEGDTI